MMALIATAPAENPYGAVQLVAGRWVNPESDEPEIVCVKKSMRRFGVPVGSLVGWLFSLKTGNWPGLPHWFVLPADVVAEGPLGALVFALVFAVPTALALVGRKRR